MPIAAGKRAVTSSSHSLSGSLTRRLGPHHPDLCDSATVHCRHLEPVALYLDGVSDGREPTEATEDEPADGVVGLVRQLEAEPFAERLKRREPIDDKRPRCLFFEDRTLEIELVLHLA